MPRRKKEGPSLEARQRGMAAGEASRNKRKIDAALSNVRSDTYKAGLSYLGGKGGKKAPFTESDVAAGIPDYYKTVAKTAKFNLEAGIKEGNPLKYAPNLEGLRNDALRARDAGDVESAQKLADVSKFYEGYKSVWGTQKQGAARPRKGGGKQQPKGGDGYTEPEEKNPFKRALGMVLGAPGVQQALKTLRTPFSYVASHTSDIAQQLEEGDIVEAVGALGRAVPIVGGITGETVDALEGKGFDIGAVLNSYENEKNRKDFWKQTGVGEYLQRGLDKHTWDDNTILNDKWVKRGIGFAGDIGLDPLTYLTAGSTKVSGSAANVATRITESGAALAAREGAEAAAKGLSREAAEEAAMAFVKKKAADVISKGKRTLTTDDMRRLFPDEKVAGGLAWRVPLTGRPTRAVMRGLTRGKFVPEEKLIPLLRKDLTNPMQRVLSKPARALGASKLADKAVGKFGGELGQEIRGLIRSGDPEEVYKGLGIKRATNIMRSRAASGVRVAEDDLREIFGDEIANKLIVNAGEESVGPDLAKLWTQYVGPAIKGREDEVLRAVEEGKFLGDEGAQAVANFYKAAHRSLERSGAKMGKVGEGQYIPWQFTEEGRKAWQETFGEIPEGTTAIDPKVAFEKARTTLSGERTFESMDEARQYIETKYGQGLKGGKVFETDINRIAANYIRQADQRLGRQALLRELEGWGIAKKVDDDYLERVIKMAETKTPKVAANNVVNKVGKSLPLAKKRKAQQAVQRVLEDEVAARADEVAAEAGEGLGGRLRAPVEATTPEEQAMVEALQEGATGEPISAADAIEVQARRDYHDAVMARINGDTSPETWAKEQEAQAILQKIGKGSTPRPVSEPAPASEVIDPVAYARAQRDAVSAADLRFQRAKLHSLANAVAWGSIHPELAMKMDLAASKRFLDELGSGVSELQHAYDNQMQHVIQRHLDEGLLRPEDVVTPTRNFAPKYKFTMPAKPAMGDNLMDVTGDMTPEGIADPLSAGVKVRRPLPAGLRAGKESLTGHPPVGSAAFMQKRQYLIDLVNDGTATPAQRSALKEMEDLRIAAAEESLAQRQVLAEQARARALARYERRVENARRHMGLDPESADDPFYYDYSQDYTGLEGEIPPDTPRFRGERRIIPSYQGGSFVDSPIPPNPTNSQMESSKALFDDFSDYLAQDSFSDWSSEARELTLKKRLGLMSPKDKIRLSELRAEHDAFNQEMFRTRQLHYDNVVKGRLYHMIQYAGRGIDVTTGEVLEVGATIKHLLQAIEESPHSEAMHRLLGRLGAAERRAIAADEKVLEVGRWDTIDVASDTRKVVDTSSIDDSLDETQEFDIEKALSGDENTLEDPSLTGGSFYNVAEADAAENGLDALQLDKLANQRNRRVETRGQIDVLNHALKSANGEEAYKIRIALWNLHNELDELELAINRTRDVLAATGDDWDEFKTSALETGSGKTREAGIETAVREAINKTRRDLRTDLFFEVRDQRNLADVHLGIERLLEDSQRLNLEIGDQQIRMAESLGGVANALYEARRGAHADFVVPNRRTVERLISGSARKGERSSKVLIDTTLQSSGARVRDFYISTRSSINAEFRKIAASEAAGQITKQQAVQFADDLVRQQTRLDAALLSGESEEMLRVMLLQSLEGTGRAELSVTSEVIDNIASAIASDSKLSMEQTLRSLTMPAHPMGQYVSPRLAHLSDPSSNFMADALASVKEHQWRVAVENNSRAVRAIINAKNERGYFLSSDYDELARLKKFRSNLGANPTQIDNGINIKAEQRISAEIEQVKMNLNSFIEDGRIVNSADGYVIADKNDKQALGVVRKYNAAKKKNNERLAAFAEQQEKLEVTRKQGIEDLIEDERKARIAESNKPLLVSGGRSVRAKTPLEKQSERLMQQLSEAYKAQDMDEVARIRNFMDDWEARRADLAPKGQEIDKSNASVAKLRAKTSKKMYSALGGSPEGKESFASSLQRRLDAGEPAPYVIAGTGTRSVVKSPSDMEALVNDLMNRIRAAQETHGSVKIVSGGAEGFDEALAVAAYRLGVPYHLDIPSPTYGNYYWKRVSQTGRNRGDIWDRMVQNAESVEFTDKRSLPKGDSNFNRNEVMMQRADEVWAFPDKGRRGGTAHGIKTARELGMEPVIIELPRSGPAGAAREGVVIGNPVVDELRPNELKGVQLAERRIAEGKTEEAFKKIQARLARGKDLSPDEFEILQAGLKRLNQHMEAKTLADDVVAAASQPAAAAQGGMVRSSANIWDDHAAGQYAVIPTNTVVKSNGEAVMGAGLAKQARDKFEGLAARYGAHLREAQANGTSAMLVDHENRLILVPTKGDWKLPSSVEQVDAALAELSTLDLPMSVPNLGAGKGQVPLKDVEALMAKHGVQPAAQAPAGVGVTSGGGPAKGPMNISLFGDEFDEFGRMLDPAVAAQRRLEERLAGGGSSMGVRGAVGGSEGGQDALNAAAAASEPEAALEDTARVLSGEADDDLIASMDEVAADPSVPSSKRILIKRGREWIKNKKTRMAKARVAAGGEPAAEAAIAIQSQAENGGIYRYMRYPTSDPTETFKRLNNLDSLDELATMADEGLNNMAWLQKSQGYVTDRETAAILNQIKTVNTPDGMRNFLKYYDKAMSFIKAWQLTTPGFHVRNTMGGIFNNYLAGVEIGSTSQFLRKLKQFKAGKLTGVEQEWMNAIYETVGAGQYSHHEIGVASNVTSNWNPLSPRYKLLAKSARFGGDVEFRLRGTLMWDRLSKGTSLQEALDDVTRYHFDYSNLSNFETGVVKRIVPFYVWTRYNFPLQIEMMAQSPSKYRFYQQFKHSMEGREDKGKPVPEFLRNEMFGIPLPTHIGGGQNFLTLDLPFTRTMAGATPDVENWDPTKLGTYPTLMDPYLSQMAVPIKAPIELALSRQFFKGIPLRDTSMSEGYLAGRTPIAESLGGKTKTDYIVEQALPMYGQLRRLIPLEKKHKDRLATNWASYVGLPLRTNTELDQANELARRRYLGR